MPVSRKKSKSPPKRKKSPVNKRKKSRSPPKRKVTFSMYNNNNNNMLPPPPARHFLHRTYNDYQSPLELIRCEQWNNHARMNKKHVGCICRPNRISPHSAEYKMFIDERRLRSKL